jgi:hypothetical protein
MKFSLMYYSVLALLWLTAGVVLLFVSTTYEEGRGDNFRYASYLAFLMVAWNALRVFQAWQKAKSSA